MFLPKQCVTILNSLSLLSHLKHISIIFMAEHPEKRLHVRADTYGGDHSQLPNDSTVESTSGQLPYSQSQHRLSTENYDPRQQDASDNLEIPTPMHFYHPMRWPQNPWSDIFKGFSSDSAHGDFDSGLEPTELEARYGAVNDSYIMAFKHQSALGQVEPSTFDLRSPISGFDPYTCYLIALEHKTDYF